MAQQSPYSKFVILVFNVPEKSFLSNSEENIFQSIKNKWATKYGQQVDIIFVKPSDVITHNPKDSFTDDKTFAYNPKFKPLTEVDEHSLLWCVGYHPLSNELLKANGNEFHRWEAMFSDESNEGEDYPFPYSAIGSLLFSYIKHPKVLLKRQNFANSLHPHRLKIVVSACNSGVGTFDQRVENLSESFSGRLFDFLLNNHKDKYLNCEVWGERGYLFPVPGKPSLKSFFKSLFEASSSLTHWFHKRYFYVQGNKLATLIPSHQPKGRKICFEMHPTTTNIDVVNRTIKPKIQTVEEKKPAQPTKKPFFIRWFVDAYHYIFNLKNYVNKKFEILWDKLHHLKAPTCSTSKLANFFHLNQKKSIPLEKQAQLFASHVDPKDNVAQYQHISAFIKHNMEHLDNPEKINKILNALEYNFDNQSFTPDQLNKSKLNELAASANSGFPHFSGNCVLLSRCLLYNLKTGRNLLAANNTHPIFTQPFLGAVSEKYSEIMLFGKRLRKARTTYPYQSMEEVEKALLEIFKKKGERFFVIHAEGHVFPVVGEINHSFNAVILGEGENATVQFVDPWKTLDRTPSAEKIQHVQEGAVFNIVYHPGPVQEIDEPEPHYEHPPSPSLSCR